MIYAIGISALHWLASLSGPSKPHCEKQKVSIFRNVSFPEQRTIHRIPKSCEFICPNLRVPRLVICSALKIVRMLGVDIWPNTVVRCDRTSQYRECARRTTTPSYYPQHSRKGIFLIRRGAVVEWVVKAGVELCMGIRRGLPAQGFGTPMARSYIKQGLPSFQEHHHSYSIDLATFIIH
jgi:hypothetical protein